MTQKISWGQALKKSDRIGSVDGIAINPAQVMGKISASVRDHDLEVGVSGHHAVVDE